MLTGVGFLFQVTNVRGQDSTVDVLNATEFYASKWKKMVNFIVYFTIKKGRKPSLSTSSSFETSLPEQFSPKAIRGPQ